MVSCISVPTGDQEFSHPKKENTLLGNVHGAASLPAEAIKRSAQDVSLPPASLVATPQEVLLLCRQAQQKWDLATVCLDHMRLAVKGLVPLSSSVSVHYPGMAVMLQLLGALLPTESTVEQAIAGADQAISTAGCPLSVRPWV